MTRHGTENLGSHARQRRARWALLAACLLAAGCGSTSAPGQPDVALEQPAPTDTTGDTTPEPTSTEPAPGEAPTTDPLRVDTTLGPVVGEITDTAVNAWTAIPYAAPPLADNRWRAPQPHPGWTDDFDATTTGRMCPQPTVTFGTRSLNSPEQDEDCLTLSVWSPDDARDLPTIVSIHGGGNLIGSAHEPLYDGTDLATEGLVVVGINYRLGALGFLAHPDAPDGAINFGVMDQQAALEWVRDNVAAFGGDPDNVTIAGHSSGGYSVCAHLAADASAGLFHKAIIQSGGGCGAYQQLKAARAVSATLVASTSCADAAEQLACLRELDAEELTRTDSPREIVGDGVVVADTGMERAAAGALNEIPIMIGSTRDEFTLFTIDMSEPSDDSLFNTVRGRTLGAADEIMALYPADDYESNLARFETIQNDLGYACAAEAFAETLAAAGGTAYRYYFAHEPEIDPDGLGATHASELVMLFRTPTAFAGYPVELDALVGTDRQLSADLQRAWASFAAKGAPDAPVPWSPTAPTAPTIMQMDTEWTSRSEIRDGRCGPVAEALGAYYAILSTLRSADL